MRWGLSLARCGVARDTTSAFAGFRFRSEVITVAVRWYLRFGQSYRDVEELLAERGVEVGHVSTCRVGAAVRIDLRRRGQPCRHALVNRWHVDETYARVCGAGAPPPGDRPVRPGGGRVLRQAAQCWCTAGFFGRAIATTQSERTEVVTDLAQAYPRVLDELLPGALPDVEQYANQQSRS